MLSQFVPSGVFMFTSTPSRFSYALRALPGRVRHWPAWLALTGAALSAPAWADPAYTVIVVLDSQTFEPISGATLTTKHKTRYTSDNNGVIAFYEPALMNRSLWFHAERPGYSLQGPFGLSGADLEVNEGEFSVMLLDKVDDAPPIDAGDEQTRLIQHGPPTAAEYFEIQVVDRQTGRGVPLIEIDTGHRSYVTDSHGRIALFEVDQMGETRTLKVTGHGYSHATGAITQHIESGGQITIEVDRQLAAQRLYRITGAGIYADSELLEYTSPTAAPLVNGDVAGQDTSWAIPYNNSLFWIWGDTLSLQGPLGNFYVAAATSDLPSEGGLDPDIGIDLNYFVDDKGFTQAMAPPDAVPGPGVAWLSQLLVVPNEDGIDSMYGFVGKWNSGFSLQKWSLVRLDDSTGMFEEVTPFSTSQLWPNGQTMRWSHGSQDTVYFGTTTRVPADPALLADLEAYTSYTPLLSHTDDTLVQDAQGRLNYEWRVDSRPLDTTLPDLEAIPKEQRLFGHIVEPETGHTPLASASTHSPNDYRQRFVRVTQEAWAATSLLGELWYWEADSPMGPWVYARKIVTHDDTTFYNPRLHPYFDKNGGKTIFFEGTYTSWMSGSEPTPRYNYNQLLYRLDLDDPQVILPVPVYDLGSKEHPELLGTKEELTPAHASPPIAFMAPDRPGDLSHQPAYWSGANCEPRRLLFGGEPITPPLFYSIPAATPPSSLQDHHIGLYEHHNPTTNARVYSVDSEATEDGFSSSEEPVAFVWRNPIDVKLPTTDYLWPLIADAGQDQCESICTTTQLAEVVLHAQVSAPQGETIVEWGWSWDHGTRHAIGPNPTLHLPEGLHPITLTVRDSAGHIDTDTLIVSVKVDKFASLIPCGDLDTDTSYTPRPVDANSGSCQSLPATPSLLVSGGLALFGMRRRRTRKPQHT